MKIIIPMSGFGERFRRVGYDVPKPLIVVDGKPIIQHVVEMFSPEDEFFFICSNDHLNNSFFNMAKILNEICPNGQIIGIDSHKLGPVFAVLRAENLFGTDEPVVVNYCDFTCYWNWSEFKVCIRK